MIHVERTFTANVHTDRGDRHHQRVHEPGHEGNGGVRIERSLPLVSKALGLHGVADVVEFHGDGSIVPIEHKVGRRAQRDADDVQVAAQAMALEEMFDVTIREARIYHHASRRRRDVPIDWSLRGKVAIVAKQVRALLDSGRSPAPVNDARCPRCSLLDACLPSAIANARHSAIDDPTFDPSWG